MSEFTEIDEGQFSFLEDTSKDEISPELDIPEDINGSDRIDNEPIDGQESFIEDDIPEKTDEYLKIGGDSVNPESPYVISRETAENSGYVEEDGNEVIDSEKVKEELALPDSNPAEYVHEMPHISEETHDLYTSNVAQTKENDFFPEHEGGGEQTIAIRQEGDPLAEGNTESPVYNPEHSPGEEDVIDDRKELDDFSNEDWESAYVENEMHDSVKEHNEKYQDNQLDFYEISNSGEHFKRADGSSALDDYQENTKK